MHKSEIIEISGQFAGAALHHGECFRFVAVDPRVKELDRSLWSTLPEMKRVVSHLLTAGHMPTQWTAPCF
jgi:hypothetical protein